MNKDLLSSQIKLAKSSLFNHGVVAFPTETVYGLGVLYNDKIAYDKLNRIKRRPENKPYTMMVKSIKDIDKYAYVDEKAKRIIERFMPGSLTILLKAKDNVPDYVTHSTGIIGIRIPTNIEAISLLKEVNLPLLVPSANRSGQKPFMDCFLLQEEFEDEIDAYIDGKCESGRPSSIIDLTKDCSLIREGPIPYSAIKCVYDGYKLIETVMIYLFKDNKVLMLYRDKKDIDINKNKWIGVGGHIEKGESPEQAVIREVKEETNITLNNFSKRALITFRFKNDIEIMHLYTSKDFLDSGNLNCDEGTLKWIDIDKIFDLPLWEGDKYFIKPILDGNDYFEMTLSYDGDKLINIQKKEN